MIKKAIILACMAFLTFFGMGIRVNAERLFILENLITNGDFSLDSNGDGIANNWRGETGIYSIVNGQQKFACNNSIGVQFIQDTTTNINFSLIQGHKYFLSYYFSGYTPTPSGTYFQVRLRGTPAVNQYVYNSNIIPNQQKIIFEYTPSGSSPFYIIFGVNTPSINSSAYGIIDNIILIDLTQLFGFGYEPSLTDFELYYLPDLDYFETYNSFEPDLYTQLNESDYLDLGEDLTGIDYTKSIIDTNGNNLDLNLSAYFYDTYNGDTLISGVFTALDYIEDNHPVMYYNGETIELNWIFSDYSKRVIILDMTDEQKTILKTILFNRNIDRSQEFFYIKVESGFLGEAKFWFSLSSKFDLLVNAKSFLISRKTVSLNDFNIMNEMYIKTYDQYNNVILPALKFNIGNTVKTSYVDNYGSMYSDISRFNFEFLLSSPSNDDTSNYELLFFYELGIFSANEVIQPPVIDSDIDFLWDMKVCDFYQIGCHLGNFANETVSTIYTKMKIDEIVGFFDGINESASRVLSIVPDNIGAIIAVILGGVGVAIIVVIIERANK